jgi:hypothetical protein
VQEGCTIVENTVVERKREFVENADLLAGMTK